MAFDAYIEIDGIPGEALDSKTKTGLKSPHIALVLAKKYQRQHLLPEEQQRDALRLLMCMLKRT